MEERIRRLNALLNDKAATPNEKEIARNILKKYKKLGHDVESVIFERHEFYFESEEQEMFFGQILGYLFGETVEQRGRKHYPNHKKRNVILQLTKAEKIELDETFHFYWANYKKQKEEAIGAFLIAYVHKNRLFAKPSSEWGRILTPEEESRARALLQVINQAELLRALWDGKSIQ